MGTCWKLNYGHTWSNLKASDGDLLGAEMSMASDPVWPLSGSSTKIRRDQTWRPVMGSC